MIAGWIIFSMVFFFVAAYILSDGFREFFWSTSTRDNDFVTFVNQLVLGKGECVKKCSSKFRSTLFIGLLFYDSKESKFTMDFIMDGVLVYDHLTLKKDDFEMLFMSMVEGFVKQIKSGKL